MYIGFISQLFFAICLVPQCVALFVRKTTKGISWEMWAIQACGYFTGLVYGLKLHELPLEIGNSWGIFCSIIFTVGFLKYKDK